MELLDQLELLDPLSSAEAQARVDSLVRRSRGASALRASNFTVYPPPARRRRRSSSSTLRRCTSGACASARPAERAKSDSLKSHIALPRRRYLQVFRKLEESYDQMVHPQKRMDIRKVSGLFVSFAPAPAARE